MSTTLANGFCSIKTLTFWERVIVSQRQQQKSTNKQKSSTMTRLFGLLFCMLVSLLGMSQQVKAELGANGCELTHKRVQDICGFQYQKEGVGVLLNTEFQLSLG